MKQKNKSTPASARQPESPFLPQKRISDSPQLRFKQPQQTEQWLLSREKTDYTYSRSASYSSSVSQSGSLRRVANSYETPIMSRSGQDESELLPQTPHSAQPGHRYSTRSSARRSNRLPAQQHEGQYENTPFREPAKSHRTRRVTKTATHMYSDQSGMQDNANEEAYRNIHESSVTDRSGAISETSHREMLTRKNQENRSLQNMYGLDGNESEFSDSDIPSGGTSTTTITTITTTTSTTWLQQQGNHYHNQAGLFPIFMRTLFSTLVVIETIVRTVVSKTITVLKSASSSVGSKVSSAGYSLGDLLMWLLSCLWMLGRKVADACGAMWYNPWFYSFRRAPITTLQDGPQYGRESEMYSTGGEYTETTTTTTTILEEERRRRRAGGIPFCCFCLPLLLLLAVSSAATGRYFIFPLLARNETNQTKGESSLHPINQQFIFLQDRINYWFTPSPHSDQEPPPDQGGFLGAMGVEGCIKCLKQDQLMGWIDSAVQREVGELRVQLYSQKDQILLLQELRGRQSKEIQALQMQLTDTIASNSNSAPSRATMDLINSLESKFSDLKASIRMLQLKVDSAAEQTDNLSPATVNLRKDFTTLTGSLAELRGSLQRLHTKCVADAQLAKSSNRQRRGDINSLNANMLTVSQKIAEVQGLELTLVQLKREMETFSQTDGHHSMQLTSVVDNINSVEASLTAIRQEMRDIELNATQVGSNSGTSASHLSALYEEMSVLKQDMTDMKIKHVGYEGSIEGLVNKHSSLLNAAKVTETDLSELRAAVNQLMSTDINSILERLSQLQTRLNGLEKDSSQLQLNVNTLQSSRTVVQQGDTDAAVNTGAIDLLQANLNKLGSQFASLQTDIASIQLKVTELKTSVSQTTQTVDIHSAKLLALSRSISALEKSLNGSVVMLSEADGTSHSLISIRDMNVLKEEMDAVHVAISKLQNELAGETASGITIVNSEINLLSSKLEHLEGRLDEAKLEASLASLDDAIRDVMQGQAGLQDNVVRLQFNTDLIKKQTSRANGDTIQLSVLETRLNDLASSIQVLLSGGFSAGSTGSTSTGSTSSQNVDWMKGDINALRQTLADINAILFVQDSSVESSSTFLASIQDRLNSLDVALANLKMSQESGNGELKAAIVGLQAEMNKLGLELQRLETSQKERSGGVGGAAGLAAGLAGATLGGAAYDDDLSKLKANMSQLQQQYAHLEVDVINCCKNKTGAAGMPWFFPFVSTGGSGEAGGSAAAGGGSLDEDRVKSIVITAFDMYNADKTGMVDYALESAGGSIISIRCSETYAFKTALFSLFGIPLWYLSNSPRTVIQPDVHPGNCWAFKGTQGYIVIQLAATIKPTAFSLEHIPKALDPAGIIDSAPKNFTVWGLRDEYDHDGYLLGSYVYDVDSSPLQFFPVQNQDSGPIQFVELKIGSNHGNMEYTCLYRLRVHGVLHR